MDRGPVGEALLRYYGLRDDNTPKGTGWWGPQRQGLNGPVQTELTVDDFPLIVPTRQPTSEDVDNAYLWSQVRRMMGQSPYYEEGLRHGYLGLR